MSNQFLECCKLQQSDNYWDQILYPVHVDVGLFWARNHESRDTSATRFDLLFSHLKIKYAPITPEVIQLLMCSPKAEVNWKIRPKCPRLLHSIKRALDTTAVHFWYT